MKLIIDIPDDIYERIKERCPDSDDCFVCQDEVFYGIPYNPTGDYISRSALIREIGRTDEWYKGHSICNIIDNAPTVEPICPYLSDNEVKQPCLNSPCEKPQGDLISREALKEDFKSRLADCNEWMEKAKDKETKIRASAVKTFIAEVIMTIDNAPTVVVDCKNCDGYEAGYSAGVRDTERPQGEWEIVDAEGCKIWNCVCTECGHDPQEYIGGTENWWLRKQHLPNFCPNCGVRIVNVKGGVE